MLFAAVSWNIIEIVVNPMLATTAAMSVLGVFFLFAGFFVLVSTALSSVDIYLPIRCCAPMTSG
jgi:hypothetical protein